MADLLDALWPGAASSSNIATTTVGRNVQLSPPLFLRNVAAGQSAVELTPSDCVLSDCRIQQVGAGGAVAPACCVLARYGGMAVARHGLLSAWR